MFSRRILLFLVLNVVTVSLSHAAGLVEVDWLVPGDRAITRDPATGLEWLDLTQSQGLSIDEVGTELLPGGDFEGFRLATPEEVETLYRAADITTIATAANTTVTSTDPAELAGAIALQSLWGITAENPAIELQRSLAFVDDQPVVGGPSYFLATLDVFPTRFGAATRGSSGGGGLAIAGTALVRSEALSRNFIDFERSGDGQVITGSSSSIPVDEYNAMGITITHSLLPLETPILATNTPATRMTMSGNVAIAQVSPPVAPTFVEISIAAGAREFAFDFALPTMVLRAQGFDQAGVVVFDSLFNTTDFFTFSITGVGEAIVPVGHAVVNAGQTLSKIRLESPNAGFFFDNLRFEEAIPMSANVASDAVLGSNVTIGENVVIESGVVVGPNTNIEDDVLIKVNSVIGDNGNIGARTTIGSDSSIGNDVILGADVVIGKNSTIGDNVAIDDLSSVSKDTVMGNNIVIGDNVSIAKESFIEDEVSIGDASIIKRGVVIQAAAIIGINVTVEKFSTISAGTTVPDGTVVPKETTFP